MRILFWLIPALFVSNIIKGQEYGVMLDAGSTGTRLYIYERSGGAIRLLEKRRIKPGISTFSTNPEGVQNYLLPLIQFAQERLSPLTELSQVSIKLQATGGVRALSKAEQESVIQSAQKALERSGFDRPVAEVITGEQEGIYQWIALNYLRKTLGPNRQIQKKRKSAGLIEMGGASLQVTFLKNELVQTESLDSQLYSVSYDGFGESSAWKRLGEEACKEIPLSYVQCRRFIASKLQEIRQPKLKGEFYLVDNFEQLASLLKLRTISSGKLDKLGPSICRKSLASLKKELPLESDYYLSKICFDTAYMSVVLEKIGFHRNRELMATKNIEGTPLTWTLGSLYDHTVAKKLKSE
ncbi:MAG: hypothetical protein I8H75_06015 [Myxococcaceae bacterium]|nr:hypothetical protein [Myxococcaceae bacterium]MBH2006871.1 hypothetical protein [Myxococcaceae bacterium]